MHIKFEKKNKNEATRTTVTFLEAEMNRIDSVKSKEWFSKEIPILFQIVNAELQICFICQIKAWKKTAFIRFVLYSGFLIRMQLNGTDNFFIR